VPNTGVYVRVHVSVYVRVPNTGVYVRVHVSVHVIVPNNAVPLQWRTRSWGAGWLKGSTLPVGSTARW